MVNKKGIPKRDSSGRGIRANMGRGGCSKTEPVGLGRSFDSYKRNFEQGFRNFRRRFREFWQ